MTEIALAKGAQIRSRTKWIEEGEKYTKVFFSLERKRATIDTISSLRVNNQNTDNSAEILREIKFFYETLYKEEKKKTQAVTLRNTF